MSKKIIAGAIIASMIMVAIFAILAPAKMDTDRFVAGRLVSSSPPRHAPIVITSNADYAGLASSGSGVAGDPWIIQSWLIECNGSGSGIIVNGADDHVIFRDIVVNESGGGGTDANILLNNAFNVDLDNVTLSNSSMMSLAVVGENITVANSSFNAAAGVYNVLVTNSSGITFDNCVFFNSTGMMQDYEIVLDSAYGANGNVTVENSRFSCLLDSGAMQAGSADLGILVVSNCTFDLRGNTAIDLNAVNVTIEECTFTNCTAGDDVIAIIDSSSYVIENNTFINAIISPGDIIYVSASNGTITGNQFLDTSTCNSIFVYQPATGTATTYITYNNFTNTHAGSDAAIYIDDEAFLDANASIVYINNNYIHHVAGFILAYWTDAIERPIVHFGHNYYREYFDWHPNAITANTSTTVLATVVNVTGENAAVGPSAPDLVHYIDSYPVYFEDWFPRTDLVSMNFYSSWDYLGIDFDIAKLYVDSTLRVAKQFHITHVLYHVEVFDFAGNSLWDRMYNVNQTTDADIGLDIVPLTISNNFNMSVIFHYTIGNVSISMPVGPGETKTIRVSLATFYYYVTDVDGLVLRDEENHRIIETIVISSPIPIDFGWVSVAPDQPINNYSSSLLDYLIVFIALGAAFAFTVIISLRARPKKKKVSSSPYARPSR